MDPLNQVISKIQDIVAIKESIDYTKYQQIKTAPPQGKILFIDGGNNEIFKAANFAVYLVRVYYCIYHHNKRINKEKKEFYLLLQQKGSIKAEIFPISYKFDELTINPNSADLKTGQKSADLSTIANIIMKCAEIKVAKEALGHLEKGDAVVRDGDLEVNNSYEEGYMNELFHSAYQKGMKVYGLAKTSELLTKNSDSFSAILSKNQPFPVWSYSVNEKTFFVKLHKSSKYVFKYQANQGDLEILPSLKDNSTDPVFLGYPYGLIEADRFARVTNQETEIAKIKFLTKTKNKLDIYQNALNAHSILDSI
ncbi:MAG: DNA double-strand break repair nuclease NurA [Nanoarchaeota archaeon]|nr:DNA double-strand break repair nuclease NurA [Nanoarchaeota archaeon]MBU1704971.1 DNA double-strand break repair nuclease NurA [Nanoarchaeota archaeon]